MTANNRGMNSAEFANIARCEREMWWFRGQRKILSELLRPFCADLSNSRVLEAGCGTGYQSAQFDAAFGWRMFPLDLDSEGLSHARQEGMQRLVQGDVAQLPFPDGCFDGVVSLDVLVHFPRGREQDVLQELVRVLRPGGLFVLRVSALDCLRSRHSMFAHERQRFTRARVTDLMSNVGIQIHRCTYANSLLLPVALFKFRVWEPLTAQPPQSGVAPVARWLDTLLHAALHLESRYLRTGMNLGLGQSLILIGRRSA